MTERMNSTQWKKIDFNAKRNDKTHHFRWIVASTNARSHITWLGISLANNNNNITGMWIIFRVQNPTNAEKHMHVSQWPYKKKLFILRSRANEKKSIKSDINFIATKYHRIHFRECLRIRYLKVALPICVATFTSTWNLRIFAKRFDLFEFCIRRYVWPRRRNGTCRPWKRVKVCAVVIHFIAIKNHSTNWHEKSVQWQKSLGNQTN